MPASMHTLLHAVSKESGIDLSELQSPRRFKRLVLWRRIYILRALKEGYSYRDIATSLGGISASAVYRTLKLAKKGAQQIHWRVDSLGQQPY